MGAIKAGGPSQITGHRRIGGSQLVTIDRVAAACLHQASGQVGDAHCTGAAAGQAQQVARIALCVSQVAHRQRIGGTGAIGEDVADRLADRIEGTADVTVAARHQVAAGIHRIEGIGRCGHRAINGHRSTTTQMGGQAAGVAMQLGTGDCIGTAGGHAAGGDIGQQGRCAAITEADPAVVHGTGGIAVIQHRTANGHAQVVGHVVDRGIHRAEGGTHIAVVARGAAQAGIDGGDRKTRRSQVATGIHAGTGTDHGRHAAGIAMQLGAGHRITAAGNHAAVGQIGQAGRAGPIAQGDPGVIHGTRGIGVVAHRAGQTIVDSGADIGDGLIHSIKGAADIVVIRTAGTAIGGHGGQGVGRRTDTAIGSDRTAAAEIGGCAQTGAVQLGTGYRIAAAGSHVAVGHIGQAGRHRTITEGHLGVVDGTVGIGVIAHCTSQARADGGVEVVDGLIHSIKGRSHVVVVAGAGAAIGRHTGQRVGRCGHRAIHIDRCTTAQGRGQAAGRAMQLGAVDRLAAGSTDLTRRQVADRGRSTAIAQRNAGVIRCAGAIVGIQHRERIAANAHRADGTAQLGHVDGIGVTAAGGHMGDLAFAPCRAHRHLADRGLGRTQAIGSVVVLATAGGIGLEAQGHRVGLVRGGPGTEQGLPVGRANGAVADDHRMTQAGIVVGRGHTGRVVGVVDTVAGKHVIGIGQRQLVAGIGTDHHFLGPIGIGTVANQHLVILGGIDRPAIRADQTQHIQTGASPVRRTIRQHQTQQAIGITVVDVEDVAVRGGPPEHGQVRVGAGTDPAQAIEQGADRAQIDHRQAQHVGDRVGLDDVGRVDRRIAVADIAITAEQVLQGRPDDAAQGTNRTPGTHDQAGGPAASGHPPRIPRLQAGWMGDRRSIGRHDHAGGCRIASQLAHRAGQAIAQPRRDTAHHGADPAQRVHRAGQATDRRTAAGHQLSGHVVHSAAHRTDHAGQVALLDSAADRAQPCIQRTGHPAHRSGQGGRAGQPPHQRTGQVADTGHQRARAIEHTGGNIAQVAGIQYVACRVLNRTDHRGQACGQGNARRCPTGDGQDR